MDTCVSAVAAGNPVALDIGMQKAFVFNSAQNYRNDTSPSCTRAPGADGVLALDIRAKGQLQTWLGETATGLVTDSGLGEAVLSLRKGASCESAVEMQCRVMSVSANPTLSIQVAPGDRVFVHWDFTDITGHQIVVGVKLSS
jgi:hypothetical protein